MIFDAHQNLLLGTVTVAPVPAASGTSLDVSADFIARAPAAPFNCCAYPAGTVPLFANAEIVRVTAIVGSTLTIVRAQEGTNARDIIAGDQIANTTSVKSFTDIETAVNAAGTVTSVGITADPILTVTNSPITTSGDINLALANQSANTALAGPASGVPTTPAFRALVEADLSLTDITTNNSTAARHGFAPKLSGNANEYLDGSGAFTTPAGSSGTVTSVDVAAPAVLLSSSGGPIVGAGTITLDLVTQNANKVLAGPTTGADATPTFRQVIEADLALTDITTADVSTAAHGFTPKLPNDSTKFLNGAGGYTVPAGGSSDWDTVITKSAPQTVTNSAVMVADSELTVAVSPSTFYQVQILILYTGNDAAGDYKGSVAVDGLITANGYSSRVDTSLTYVLSGSGASPTQWPSTDLALGIFLGDDRICSINLLLMTDGSATTLNWQFANNAAGVGRTSTTQAGSTLKIKKLSP